MRFELTLAMVGLATVACGEISPSTHHEAALAAASVYSGGILSPAAANLSETPPFLEDTAKTVTRRVWPDAELYDISPDGRLAVQTDWTSGDLAVRDMETGEVRHLTHNRARFDPGEAEDARFSPDGRWVAYTWYDEAQPAFYKLGVVDIEGTNPRLIYRDPATGWIQAEDWSPGGEYVLASRSVTGKDANELLLISAEDGTHRLLKSFPDPSRSGEGGMRFSPDGRHVAYHFWSDDPENRDLFVIDVETGEEHALLVHPADDRILGWAPDGRHILFGSDRSGTPGAWLLPVEGGRANGDPWLVKPDMWRTGGVRMSPDGRYFFKVITGRRDIYVVGFDPETNTIIGSPTAITARSPGNSIASIWSPDGRHLAYVSHPGSSNALEEIVVHSIETGDVKHFKLGEPGHVIVRGWTADGRSLEVFVSNPGDEDDRMTKFRIDVQTGRKEALPDPRQSIPLVYPRLQSEPTHLVYLVPDENPEGQAAFQLLRYEVATGDSTVLFQTPYGAWGQILSPSLSPDGQTLAFGYSPVVGSNPHSLVLLPVTGEEPREIPIEGTRGLAWMPDGKGLLFSRFVGIGPVWEFWHLDLSREVPEPIGLTVEGTVIRLDVHPNGQQLTYTATKGGTELWVMENFLPEASAGGER